MEEQKKIVIDEKKSLSLVQDTLVEKSENYIKLGLNQIQGSEKITLKEECERIKKDAHNSKGTICGCCGQKVQLYKRTLTPQMAICLMYMLKFYRHSEKAVELHYYTKKDFFFEIMDKKKLKYIVNDFTKLKYWDLIAPMPTSPDKIIYKKGYYALTENGIKFTQREIGVPKHAFIYNDMVDSHSTEFVTIDDLLKPTGITYEEFMGIKEVKK